MKQLLLLTFLAVASEAMAQDGQCVRERTAMVETIRAYARSEVDVLGPQGISQRVLEVIGQVYATEQYPPGLEPMALHFEPKNRDFSKALKRYFPEGFSIQRERATAICRVHPPVTDRRGRSPSLAKLKAARDRKIAAGEKVRRPQELRGSTAWRCRAGPSVTPLRSRSPADLFTLFLPNAAMSRQPAGHTKLRPSRLTDRCQS